MSIVYYYPIILISVIFDQLTKIWIANSFSMYESLEVVPGFFNLVYTINKGAAFSILADVNSPWRHYFFIGVGGAAIVGLTLVYYQTRNQHKLHSLALALICGGAIGNLIDRIRLGHVIDFLDFYYQSYHWPAFNVADSSICVGVGLFLLVTFMQNESNEIQTQEH